MRFKIALFSVILTFSNLFFGGCSPDDIRQLRLNIPVCSWLQNDYLIRYGTETAPHTIDYSQAVVEIMFLTNAVTYTASSEGILMAERLSRVEQRIDSISIISSVDMGIDYPAGVNLAETLFTLVHYPNLQLRDYRRTLEQFNEHIQSTRQSSESYYLYLRMLEKRPDTPFNLSFNFFLNDGIVLSCDCDWVQYL